VPSPSAERPLAAWIPDNLYAQILAAVPLACVDLAITDPAGRVLLVRRANQPAAGQWWFPGGRVHRLERRADAAVRKLREECGLVAEECRELATLDLILDDSHGITTVFQMTVAGGDPTLDSQSTAAEWRSPAEWRQLALHPFVATTLATLQERTA
jgi:8-oxo-dGTP diphosphatase